MNPEEYEQEIGISARSAAKSFGGRFDWDDIAQAITLDMLAHPKIYDGLKGNLLMWVLKRTAMKWCAQECAKFLKFGDQTIYSSEELKPLLFKYYEPSSWPNGLSQPSWDDYDDIDTFKEVLDEWASDTKLSVDMLDIDHAIKLLTTAQRNIIQKKYRDRERLASKYELNLHSVAIRYLTYHVNHRVEEKGMTKPVRKVVSNSQAIASLGWQEEMNSRPGNSDGLARYQATMSYNHPTNKQSRYVVNSPWRKA